MDADIKAAVNQADYSNAFDVFLSYRRDGGETMAVLLRDRLVEKGYRVFLDVESLNPGSFNEQLLDVIEHCTDFLLICSKDSLDRCKNKEDWVRREISHALANKINVIPFMLRGFKWPRNLPEDILTLPLQNGVTADNNVYFDAAIDILCNKYLKSKIAKEPSTIKALERPDNQRNINLQPLPELTEETPVEAFEWYENKEGSLSIKFNKSYLNKFIVDDKPADIVVPKVIDGKAVTCLSYGAFTGCKINSLMLPKTLDTLIAYSFSRCVIKKLYLPDSVLTIHDTAFADSIITLFVEPGSYAEKFAHEHGMRVEYTNF